jgi:hypothetical protein
MTQPAQYSVRDSYGNIYGPASIELLRQWIGEGRIIAGMQIAPEGTENWIEVSTHPGLADLFAKPASPTPQLVPTRDPRLGTPTPATSTAPIDLAYHGSITRRPTHALAIVSLITGILSFFFCCCFIGAVPGLTAVITGIFGYREIKARPDQYTGETLAIIGIVLGSIELVLQLLIWGANILNILLNAGR